MTECIIWDRIRTQGDDFLFKMEFLDVYDNDNTLYEARIRTLISFTDLSIDIFIFDL